MALPEFIRPMLAKIGKPFDDPGWIFEIKWDGTRALAFVEGGDYRLLNRKKNDSRPRYPELDVLRALPSGTILDGEIAVLVDGRPSFHGMLQREQARGSPRVRAVASRLPAVYVVFDLLYEDGAPILDRPLRDRRDALRRVLERADVGGRVVLSDGVVGEGIAAFDEAGRRDLEGIVAKRLDSRYLPGKRSDAWLKIKRAQHVLCAILGFLPEGSRAVSSLVIATEEAGALVPAGRVGSGLDASTRAELRARLDPLVVDAPLLPAAAELIAGGETVRWVEPGVFCEVRFLERTPDGQLRAPVFVRVVDG
jgi:DNA ligase D-like protein (predicted ligase)